MRTWVLLRGLTREVGHWGDFPKQLEDACKGDKVICIDLPGNGADYQVESPRSVYEMMEHVRRRFKETAVGEPVKVLALSLGGMVAVEWARHYPAEIESLVLMNTSMRPFSPPWKRLRPRNYPALFQAIFTKDKAKREQIVLRLTSQRYDENNASDLLNDWVELAEQHPVSRKSTLNQLLAAARYQAPKQLTVPVLVLCGGQDQLVHPSCSQAIATTWSAKLFVHSDAGHDLVLDDPKWIIEKLPKKPLQRCVSSYSCYLPN